MKKKYSSLLYCSALLSLMSTNVYAIMPKGYDFEKVQAQNQMVVEWINIIILFAIIYIVCMVVYCIKSKKTIREKIKKVLLFSVITVLILFLIAWGGFYIIHETDLYKLFL